MVDEPECPACVTLGNGPQSLWRMFRGPWRWSPSEPDAGGGGADSHSTPGATGPGDEGAAPATYAAGDIGRSEPPLGDDRTHTALHAELAEPAGPVAPSGRSRPPAPPLPQGCGRDIQETAAPSAAANTHPGPGVSTGTGHDGQPNPTMPAWAPAGRTTDWDAPPGRAPEARHAQPCAVQAAAAAMGRSQGLAQGAPTPSAGWPPQGHFPPAGQRPREQAAAGDPSGGGPRGTPPYSGPRPGAWPPSGDGGGQHASAPSGGFDGLDPRGWVFARCHRISKEGRFSIPPQVAASIIRHAAADIVVMGALTRSISSCVSLVAFSISVIA